MHSSSHLLTAIAGLSGTLEEQNVQTIQLNQEKDKLTRRIQQLDIEMKSFNDAHEEILMQNSEYYEKMARFEEIMSQIEEDKSSLDKKLTSLEDQNLELTRRTQNLTSELNQQKNQNAQQEKTIAALREQIKVNESINDYKDKEAQEGMEANQRVELLEAEIKELKKSLQEEKTRIEEKEGEAEGAQIETNQVKEELKKEREFVAGLRKEIHELRQKYADSMETRKQDLNVSNLMTSKMFNYYKNRESVNNATPNVPPNLDKISLESAVRRPTNNGSESPLKAASNKNPYLDDDDANGDSDPRPFGNLDNPTSENPKKDQAPKEISQPKDTSEGLNFRSLPEPIKANLRDSTMLVRESHFGHFLSAMGGNNFSKKKDYLDICSNSKIRAEVFKKEGRVDLTECFSDYIFLYNKKLVKSRHLIVITAANIYILSLKHRLLYSSPLSSLSNVSMACNNCTLLALTLTGSQKSKDIVLIESYRRIEVIVYCARGLRDKGLALFKLKVRQDFKAKSGNKNGRTTKKGDAEEDDAPLKDIPQKEIQKSKKNVEKSFLKETIRNAKKSGYLKILKKGIFSTSFQEYFFVLCDLGLLYFRRYDDKRVSGFIPVLGASIKMYPKSTFGKQNVFSVRFLEEETILQAVSKVDLEEWSKILKETQEKGLTGKDTMKEIGKIL